MVGLLSNPPHPTTMVRSKTFQYRSRRNWIPCFSLENVGFSHFFFCLGLGNVITRGKEQTFFSQIKWAS